MFDKLERIREKYEKLTELIGDSAVIADQERWRGLMKEHAELEPVMEKYNEYRSTREQLAELREMQEITDDGEMLELIGEELEEKTVLLPGLEEELKLLLIPKDPNDDRNVMLEIRAGTGGEEAALFGMDLLRMYMRYAERHRFKTEIMSSNYTEKGGVKEVAVMITGKGAYAKLKYESGVHRVQRVPETESQGRIQTSATTVAVLPEAEDVDIQVNMNDLRIDVYRASGNGGQCVNTTDSAVRITHLPTGLVVTCQDEKSQLKNKDKALKVLKTRLYDLAISEQNRELAENRRSQVGSGDRSERIRTYNFPQGRLTDHRIRLTIYRLEAFMDGDLDEVISALELNDRMKKMEE